MTPLARRSSAALLALLVAGGGSRAAFGTVEGALRAYEAGLRELRFERWVPAAAKLREAIARDPAESPEPVARPYGMVFAPYLPHHHLGLALCRQGELAGATAAWAESDRQGAVARAATASELDMDRRGCELELVGAAQAELASSWSAVEERWASSPPERPAAIDAIYRALVEKRAGLADSDDPLALVGFASEARELARRLGELPAAPREPTASRDRRAPDAAPILAEATELVRAAETAAATGLPVDAAGHAAVVRVKVDLAELAGRGAGKETELVAELAIAARSAAQALASTIEAGRLPSPLLAAARALFADDPEGALAAVEGFAPTRPRARAQTHLLRAAALHALVAVARGDAADLRARRDAEIRACRLSDALLVPIAPYFSPEFRSLFAAVAPSH